MDLEETEFLETLGSVKAKELDQSMLSRARRLEMVSKVSNAKEFEWILITDADCVALRNPDHLFVGNSDILVSMMGDSPDPGFFAVRGARLQDFVIALKTAGGLTKTGLTSVVRSSTWKVREFERGEVLRPNDTGVSLSDLAHATVIHFTGMEPENKHRLAFAFHMMAVYGDRDGLFFDMMEA